MEAWREAPGDLGTIHTHYVSKSNFTLWRTAKRERHTRLSVFSMVLLLLLLWVISSQPAPRGKIMLIKCCKS